MIYYLIFIYYILWLQNSNLILKSDLTALICFSDDEFSLMQEKLIGKIASVSDQKFLEQYLMQYKDFTGELEQDARDVSDQIESDAVKIADNLQNSIDNVGEVVEDTVQKILDTFKDFGL